MIFLFQIQTLGKGLHNDTVKAYVFKKRSGKKYEADVVEVLERSKTQFVGVLQKNKNFGFVVPDNNKMYADIFISESKMNGQKMVIKYKLQFQIGQKI